VENGANDVLRVRLASDRSGTWKLALRQFETHQLPQAIDTLKTIPAIPENWIRDYLIATACLLRNDVTGAEEIVNGRLLASRKTSLVQMLRWEVLEALAHFYFSRLLDDFPNSCRGHFVKARILDAQGKKEAIDEYRAAIAADPKQPGIRLALAESYVGASRLNEALEECKRELELNPTSSAAKARIGRIYVDFRQADEAIPYLEDALRKAPEDPDAHAALGRAHELRGEEQKAAVEYGRALALNPGLNRLHYVLAELYRRLGKDTLAQSEFDLFQQAGIAERQQHVESVQRYYGGRQSRDQER
jgi:tetratricopeptide (TPR) repeat protein